MKTRAALFHEPGVDLEVREVNLEDPEPGDILVRMGAIGVCGSDLHVLKGEWPRPTPIILGHEGAGTVEAVGSAVEGVAVGDRVAISWAPACGACDACSHGRVTACIPLRAAIGAGTMLDGTTRFSADGETVFRMATVGALSEHVVVPAATALPLPSDVTLSEAALLGCAALTGVGAVTNAARVEAGSSVLVIGAGGVGQFVVQAARAAGATEIVVVDPIVARCEQALALGATAAVVPAEFDELMRQIAPHGVDDAFEVVGSAHTAKLALRWTRNGGKAVLVGMPPVGTRLDVNPFDFTNREKTLTGTIYGSEDPARALPRLFELMREGRLELGSMLGPEYPLDGVNEAIEESLAGSPRRVLVTP